jgi:tetratricopeptide (TPR) repeat protein
VADNTARTQQIAELLRVASMQQQAMDYARAWDSLEKAAQLAGSGDALAKLLDHHEADTAKVRSQREELAMAWLENITVPEGKSFSDIVDKLVPALEAGTGATGTAGATAQHKADLLAHIGWSYFLRSRDGHNTFDPSQQYAQAIALDPQNPFAHAYWGHWILWQGESLDNALAHFSQALQSGREREHVRDIELVALNNAGSRAEPEFIAAEIAMLRNNEALSDLYRTIGRRVLENACGKWGQPELAALKAKLSGADLIWIDTQLTEHADADELHARNECLAKLK